MGEQERPLGITIIGALWIIRGLLALVAGLGVATVGTLVAGGIGLVIGLLMILLGLIDLALGVGCMKAWPWVWTVGVIVAILNVISGIMEIASTGIRGALAIIIPVIILYYLMQPQVKAWFGTE